MKPESMKQE